MIFADECGIQQVCNSNIDHAYFSSFTHLMYILIIIRAKIMLYAFLEIKNKLILNHCFFPEFKLIYVDVIRNQW